MAEEVIPKFREFIEKICPRCKGSGTEEIFGYMYGDAQPMARLIVCRVCKGKGKIVERRIVYKR